LDKAEFGVSITINQEALDRILKHAKDSLSRAMKYTAADVWGNIRRLAPTDTGRLAGSFEIEQVDDLSWRIFTNVHYALYVHEGTGIYGPTGHPIVPVTAKALKFHWKKTGKTMVFKGDVPPGQGGSFRRWAEERGMTPIFAWVKGMPGRPFASQAIEMTSQVVQQFIQRAIRETGWGETS
jgi:hypothetical protein